MSLTLETLYRDHDNLRRLLYLLEQLLIDICRGSSHVDPMLQRILAYIQDYPERVHHPAEDAMFSIMFDKGISDTKLRNDIKTLMKDHSEIEFITREAMEAVEPALVSTRTSIPVVLEKLSSLISRQRTHLLFEELNIYPHVTEHLDGEDWIRISALVPDHEDPLFGARVRKEYELIFKAL